MVVISVYESIRCFDLPCDFVRVFFAELGAAGSVATEMGCVVGDRVGLLRSARRACTAIACAAG